MTEAEWLTTTDHARRLVFLRSRVSERKLRLFLCAGCRHHPHVLYSTSSTNALDIVERCADGSAPESDLGHANWIAETPTFGFDFPTETGAWHYDPDPKTVSRLVELGALTPAPTGGAWHVDQAVKQRLQAAAELVYMTCYDAYSDDVMVRMAHEIDRIDWPGRWLYECVFGNPFHPVALDPAWRTEAVVGLAAGVYADRAFDRLPILADALEDAGCADADVLTHCRGPGPHVRGCWVVDLLLGKT